MYHTNRNTYRKGDTMIKLTRKQSDVMQVLWDSDKSMTAHEVTEASDTLNINTVQACLKTLLKNEYIRVAQIVQSGTVLCRSYAPVISKSAYVDQIFGEDKSTLAIANLIDATDSLDVLDDLQKLIDKKRQELLKKNR